jgi:ABC-type phosphate transport system substrate-binding protein
MPVRSIAERMRWARRPRILAGFAVVGLAAASSLTADPAAGQAAPPPDACNGVETAVQLIGSTSAREAFNKWGLAICDQVDVVPEYLDLSSKGGRDAVAAADGNVIGLTALPFTAEEQTAMAALHRGVVMVPILATSVGCGYWDVYLGNPDLISGTRFPNMRISRRTLADLFGGSPRDFTNYSPDLAADNAANPDFVQRPPLMQVEPRIKGGYTEVSYLLSDWFNRDEQARNDFLKSSFSGATLPFELTPAPSGPYPQLFNDYALMKTRMTETNNTLGLSCMDTANALTDLTPDTPAITKLNMAWFDNAAGQFVAPTPESVSAGVAGMKPQADGTYTIDPALADPLAYPLPMLVYAALPTCGLDTATRDAMDDVISYALVAGQANLPDGNVPLPKDDDPETPDVTQTAGKQLELWRGLASTTKSCTASTTTTTTSGGSTSSTSGGNGTTTTTAPVGVVTTLPGGGIAPSDPGGDLAAGPPATDGSGDTPGGSDEGPLAPVSRIVAVARGFAALPPLFVLLVGVGLLIGGPALQIAGGKRRAGSLVWSVSTWFKRLLP